MADQIAEKSDASHKFEASIRKRAKPVLSTEERADFAHRKAIDEAGFAAERAARAAQAATKRAKEADERLEALQAADTKSRGE